MFSFSPFFSYFQYSLGIFVQSILGIFRNKIFGFLKIQSGTSGPLFVALFLQYFDTVGWVF